MGKKLSKKEAKKEEEKYERSLHFSHQEEGRELANPIPEAANKWENTRMINGHRYIL